MAAEPAADHEQSTQEIGLISSLIARAEALLFLVPGALFVWFLAQLPQLTQTGLNFARPWLPSFGVDFSLRLDGLAMLFALLITGIGTLVFIFAQAYFDDVAKHRRFAWTTLAFMFAMLGVVCADNVFLLFLFWELTGITSWLLISFKNGELKARKAALQALLVTGGGGLVMLAGLVGLAAHFETPSLLAMLTDSADAGPLPQWIVLCIIVGAFTKSAQWPMHFWLPGAMAAPTPISAYLHSATMVKAGVYLLARVAPLCAMDPLWTPLLLTLGTVTMAWGSFVAFVQNDMKNMLAWTTVAALGTMVALIGIATPLAAKAMVVFLLAHGLYKSSLFLACGAIETATGTRNLSDLRGLWQRVPLVAIAVLVAALSAAGIPPLLGFIGKELLLEAKLTILNSSLSSGPVILFLSVAAVILAVGVSGRLIALPLFGRVRASGDGPTAASVPEVSRRRSLQMVLPPATLATIGLVFGVISGLIANSIVLTAVQALSPDTQTMSLGLWHGVTPALLISVACVAIGAALAFAYERNSSLAGVLAIALARLPSGEKMFAAALDASLRFGARVTQFVQSAHLRKSIARTLGFSTVSLAFAICAAIGLSTSSRMTLAALWDSSTRSLAHGGMMAFDFAAAVFIIGGSVAAALAQSRIVAVIAMGSAGFGMAAFFALFGAPDLALTQFSVEAVFVLLMVVALGALPPIVRRTKSRWQKFAEVAVSVGFGVVIAVVALLGMVTAADSRLTAWFAERSLALANGRNVVNVILVDFRAFDTFGEITVLAIAGLGLAALFALPLGGTQKTSAASHVNAASTPSVIFAASAVPIMIGLLFAAAWFLVRGHNLPGGGFIAGLLAGATVVLREMARGTPPSVLLARRRDAVTIALGLAVAIGAGLFGLLSGMPLFKGYWLGTPLPIVGKVGTPVLFDVGVFLVVTGMSGRVYAALVNAGGQSSYAAGKAGRP